MLLRTILYHYRVSDSTVSTVIPTKPPPSLTGFYASCVCTCLEARLLPIIIYGVFFFFVFIFLSFYFYFIFFLLLFVMSYLCTVRRTNPFLVRQLVYCEFSFF